MIANLSEYFKPEQELYLEAINYNRVENTLIKDKNVTLLCHDNVSSMLEDDGVRVVIKRTVTFDPELFFSLSVSFGAVLKFNSRKKEHDWKNINLAEEFSQNGDFVTSQLMSRNSLLIAQITSSFGQQPLILPAGLTKKKQ